MRTWQRLAAVIVPITSAAMRCSTPKWLETLATTLATKRVQLGKAATLATKRVQLGKAATLVKAAVLAMAALKVAVLAMVAMQAQPEQPEQSMQVVTPARLWARWLQLPAMW